MRAILLATGEAGALADLTSRIPTSLLPLGGRTPLEHSLQQLASTGVREVHVLLGDGAREAECCLDAFDAGPMRIIRHLLVGESGYDRVRRIALTDPDSKVLIGRADVLPMTDLRGMAETGGLLWVHQARDGDARWTHWAAVPARRLAHMPDATVTDRDFLAYLQRNPAAGSRDHLAESCLDLRTPAGVLAAQRAVLEGRIGWIQPRGHETQPGVWIEDGAKVHPGAELRPPVQIGASTEVRAGARLGPRVVVGSGCVVDKGAVLADALVLRNTHIHREHLLEGGLADRSRRLLIHPGGGEHADDDLLPSPPSNLDPKALALLALERALAAAAFVLFAPALLAITLFLWVRGKGDTIQMRRIARLPAPVNPALWEETEVRDFGLESKAPGDRSRLEEAIVRAGFDRLLGLFDVMLGRLAWVGPEAMTAEELEELPEDWRTVHLRGRPGLVQPWELTHGQDPSDEVRYTEDARHGASKSLAGDLWIFMRWLFLPKVDVAPPLEEIELDATASLAFADPCDAARRPQAVQRMVDLAGPGLDAMARGLRHEDAETLRAGAHTLAGLLHGLGYRSAFEKAHGIAAAARCSRFEGVEERVQALADELATLRAGLQEGGLAA